ncbi:MAG: DUF167 domain-containing protein, partial [Blastocatellia bacterium]
MLKIKEKDGAVIFEIRVQPRASRSEIVGEHDGSLKVKVTAPPLDGRANDECVKLIADTLKVQRGSIEIIAGETSRTKVVRVKGVTGEQAK